MIDVCIFPTSLKLENITHTFSNFQCGLGQGLSAQYCLISMIEKWQKSVEKRKTFTTLNTDLSKAFHCLPHDLLIAKLSGYGFSFPATRLIQSYLSNRK